MFYDFLYNKKDLDPLLGDVAKALWDKAYELFKDTINESSITDLVSDIIWCLSLESNTAQGLLNVIEITDAESKKDFFKKYCEENQYKFKYRKPNFIEENIEMLCLSTRLNEILTFTKETLSKQNSNIDLLHREWYDYGNLPSSTFESLVSLPLVDYLNKYEQVKTTKKAVKESIDNHIIWKLRSANSLFWKEDDIVLEDMAYVWSSSEKFSRFLDKKARWGFIDVVSRKKYYMPDNVDSIRDCKCGRSVYYDKLFGTYGYISCQGKVLIEPKYATATDFVRLNGNYIAAVQLSADEEAKWIYDSENDDEFPDFSNYMGITIFDNLITIDLEGNFTPDIQQKYNEEVEKYHKGLVDFDDGLSDELPEGWASKFYVIPENTCCETEDDIMRALEGGYGDMFGF